MKDVQKMYQEYNDALVKSKAGDGAARNDKGRIMKEIRQAERESARAGTVLNPVLNGPGQIKIESKSAPSRRSLQEEYTRRFNETAVVEFQKRDGTKFVGTLRDYHTQRLVAR